MADMSVKNMFDLSGKVAFVTGARNLGYDIAAALGELGAVVIVSSRDDKTAKSYSDRLYDEWKIKASGLKLDVTDEKNWEYVVKCIIEQYSRIDILVNNAGGRSPSCDYDPAQDPDADFLENRSLDEWKYTIDVNLTGAFLGCREVVPHMKRSGKGKIINIASIDGIVGRDLRIYKGTGMRPTVPDYLAGKSGVIGLTRALAVTLAPYGINVNSISPGGFYRGQPDGFVSNYCQSVPIGRMGRDGIDIKGAAAFLASEASDYVVGHNLVVDGGWTAW